MRVRALCLLALAFASMAAAADKSPLNMSYVETKDLRLIYFDALEFLVPHAIRTFTNSLEFQRMSASMPVIRPLCTSTFGW